MTKLEQEFFKQNQLLVAQNLRASHKILTKLEKSKASTETMVDSLPDCYFVIDSKGRILKGNISAASLLSVDAMDELINKSIRRLFRIETWNIFKSKMDIVINNNEIEQEGKISAGESFELVIDGEGIEKSYYLWNLRVFSGISDRRSRLICALGRDITQIRQYEKQLSQIFSVIPLGIITINETGFIEGPYSAYMEYLFDRKMISGTNFFDLVFKESLKYMSKMEQLGIVELKEMFGKEPVWFEVSKKRFPNEIYCLQKNGDGRWIGITYHPILAEGVIAQMLIILDERTEIVKARREQESRRNKESLMIQRIMDLQRCDDATLASSFEDLDSLLIRMEAVLREGDARGYCNILHGIKGVVRTAGFSYFRNLTHDIEDEVLPILAEKKTLPTTLMEQKFELINREWKDLIKLRKMQTLGGDDISSYHSVVQKASKLKKILKEIENNYPLLFKGDGKEELSKLAFEIKHLTNRPLSSLEPRLNTRAKRTAAYLGKKVNIEFDWEKIFLDEKIISQLSEIFIHLIANAIDHGIESVDERKLKGKVENGTIKIVAKKSENEVSFEFSDDGRGIDLDVIRTKALEKNLIELAELDRMNVENVLRLIFKAGFSTHDKITDLSGRGIGLDSVQQVVSRLDGDDVKVTLLDPGMKFSFLIRFS